MSSIETSIISTDYVRPFNEPVTRYGPSDFDSPCLFNGTAVFYNSTIFNGSATFNGLTPGVVSDADLADTLQDSKDYTDGRFTAILPTITGISNDTTLADSSAVELVTEHAVKVYADTKVASSILPTITGISNDTTLADSSATELVTEHAVKVYADTKVASTILPTITGISNDTTLADGSATELVTENAVKTYALTKMSNQITFPMQIRTSDVSYYNVGSSPAIPVATATFCGHDYRFRYPELTYATEDCNISVVVYLGPDVDLDKAITLTMRAYGRVNATAPGQDVPLRVQRCVLRPGVSGAALYPSATTTATVDATSWTTAYTMTNTTIQTFTPSVEFAAPPIAAGDTVNFTITRDHLNKGTYLSDLYTNSVMCTMWKKYT